MSSLSLSGFIAEAIFSDAVDLIIISSIVSTIWGSSTNFCFHNFLERGVFMACFKISSCSFHDLFIFMKRHIFIRACEVLSHLFDSIIVIMLKPLSTIEFDLVNVSISSPRIQIFENVFHLYFTVFS